jgi:hypothetical protein
MTDLIIAGTKRTPTVNFIYSENELNISGISILEDPFPFFKKLKIWIVCYLNEKNPSTVVFNIDLEYINTSAVTLFFDLFKYINENNGSLYVNWIYDEDDEGIYDLGKTFEESLALKFNFLSMN